MARPINSILMFRGGMARPINFTMAVLFPCPISFSCPVIITNLFLISLLYSFSSLILYSWYSTISQLSQFHKLFIRLIFLVFLSSVFVTINTTNEPAMKIILSFLERLRKSHSKLISSHFIIPIQKLKKWVRANPFTNF